MIKLFAFLGNYGKEYKDTRHNAGFFCAENLSLTKELSWLNKFTGEYAKANSSYFNETLHFLKPLTYMNRSGDSIAQVVKFYKIKPNEVLVFHDELELEKATLSLKWAGGLGGHNGLRSIKAQLGTADFWRLRVGIGRPTNEQFDISDYVLSRFTKNEIENLQFQIPKLDKLIDEILKCEEDEALKALIPKWAKIKLMEK
ncbi:MAG: aminoacyl-tRNA hydrolase [Treponemataceae bacterium]